MYKKIRICTFFGLLASHALHYGSNPAKITQAVINNDRSSFTKLISAYVEGGGSVNDLFVAQYAGPGSGPIGNIGEISTSVNSQIPIGTEKHPLLLWIISYNSKNVLNELIKLNNQELSKKKDDKKYNEKYIINFDAKTRMLNGTEVDYLWVTTLLNRHHILKILLEKTPLKNNINNFVDTMPPIDEELIKQGIKEGYYGDKTFEQIMKDEKYQTSINSKISNDSIAHKSNFNPLMLGIIGGEDGFGKTIKTLYQHGALVKIKNQNYGRNKEKTYKFLMNGQTIEEVIKDECQWDFNALNYAAETNKTDSVNTLIGTGKFSYKEIVDAYNLTKGNEKLKDAGDALIGNVSGHILKKNYGNHFARNIVSFLTDYVEPFNQNFKKSY